MENILFEVMEEIAIITINRPTKLNALNNQTIQELVQTVKECENRPDIRATIITGSGEKAFVAGADIGELNTLNKQEAIQLSTKNQKDLFDRISNSEKPFIACINGYALGGGLELALACHIRYASDNAILGLPELNLGIIPGYGGTQRLSLILGKSRAIEMILTSESIKSEMALRYGLVDAVMPLQNLLEYAKGKLNLIKSKSPLAVQAALKAINAQSNKNVDGYAIEIEEFGNLFESEDFKEGTRAFLEKRKPVFKGK